MEFLEILLTNPNAKNQLPRDDYRECAELTMILLHDEPPRGIHYMAPGVYSNARWMANIIYGLKMYI